MKRNGSAPLRVCTCCRETFSVPDPHQPKCPPNLKMLRRCDLCRRCCLPNVRCLLGTEIAEIPGATMRERTERLHSDWSDHLPAGNRLWEWDEERGRFVPRWVVQGEAGAQVLSALSCCPRCPGVLVREGDRWGAYLLCLNCGDHIELTGPPAPRGMREPALIGA